MLHRESRITFGRLQNYSGQHRIAALMSAHEKSSPGARHLSDLLFSNVSLTIPGNNYRVMLKVLGILAITVFVAVSVSGQPGKTANGKQQVGENSQPSLISANAHSKQNCGQTDQAKASPDSPAGNTLIEQPHWWTNSEWWLVIIAGLTGGVIGWQSWETRKSAQATRDSIPHQEKAAKAASLNAKAAIGIAIPTLRLETFELIADWRDQDSLRSPVLKIIVRNYGTTPAFLTSMALAFICGDLPAKPDYTSVPYSGDRVVPAGKDRTLTAQRSLPYLSTDEVKAITEERTGFTICVRLSYQDIFESPVRRLVFCRNLLHLSEDGSSEWFGDQHNEYTEQNPN